jgi:hypothetical protein
MLLPKNTRLCREKCALKKNAKIGKIQKLDIFLTQSGVILKTTKGVDDPLEHVTGATKTAIGGNRYVVPL